MKNSKELYIALAEMLEDAHHINKGETEILKEGKHPIVHELGGTIYCDPAHLPGILADATRKLGEDGFGGIDLHIMVMGYQYYVANLSTHTSGADQDENETFLVFSEY